VLTPGIRAGLWPADRDVVIVGAGGFAREVLGICIDLGLADRVVGFVDEDTAKHGLTVDGKPVLGGYSALTTQLGAFSPCFLVGVGSGLARRNVSEHLEAAGIGPATVVSPHAVISPFARIDPGSMICAGAILNTASRIGRHSIVNLAATVGHDSVIEQFVHIAPGVNVSGCVTVGQGTVVGSGATINESVQIGEWSVVGSGAAVVNDIPANSTAVGVPARVIKTRSTDWHRA
jgi:sugar O-acyltransferase (sialic acid O-acetyltransferase NeuD family)